MHRLKSRPICETCLHVLDGASAIDGSDSEAQSGDVSLCIYCGQVSIYTDDLNLRKITDEELEEIKQENSEDYKKLVLASTYIKIKTTQN